MFIYLFHSYDIILKKDCFELAKLLIFLGWLVIDVSHLIHNQAYLALHHLAGSSQHNGLDIIFVSYWDES
jgi:hypothetical protein